MAENFFRELLRHAAQLIGQQDREQTAASGLRPAQVGLLQL